MERGFCGFQSIGHSFSGLSAIICPIRVIRVLSIYFTASFFYAIIVAKIFALCNISPICGVLQVRASDDRSSKVRTEDGYVIHKCLNGDPAAFGLLVDKYRESIYGLAYSKLGNFHDAEDVTQEVFIKAYQKLRTLKRYDSFLAWLYSITTNLCKNWLRSRSRRPDKESIEDRKPETFSILSIDSYRQENMLESVREAVDSLPEIYRQVLILHYLSGMSGKEIARLLGTSSGNIRQRLLRARALLREEMHTMVPEAFKEQRLRVGFTFRIIEAVKRLKIQPTQRSTNLPWGVSLAAGVIIAVMSMGSHLSTFTPIEAPTFAALPSEAKVVELGEIPVDIFVIDQIPILANNKGDGDNGDNESLSPQRASFMAPDGETNFTNVAKEAGLSEIKRYNSMVVVWGDYNNDGQLDLYVAHSGVGPNFIMEADVLYLNNGDGTFIDVTAEAGLEKNEGDARHAGSLDYDNDGYLDLYVYNPTWNGALDNRLLLYRNNGDSTFTDVTEDAGIERVAGGARSGSGTFADYDNDGDLDMYFIFFWGDSVFYENNGDGTFTDQTVKAGLEGDLWDFQNFHTTSGDYDNDGDMDIYLSNGTGVGTIVPAVLYRNNGDGTFTDVAEEAGVSEDRNGRAVAFFDYDNDGDLDLLAGGEPRNRFYRNNGDGTFTDVAQEAGIRLSYFHGLAVGDYDNDGYMDAFAMEWNKPRMLYHNNGDGTFTDVAAEVGVKTQATTGGCAFADYDNDGDLDLYVANLRSLDMLYRNNGTDNNWLHIKLIGTASNRDGIGARVTVKAGDLSMIREINPGYSHSQHSLTAHFGLGQNAQADIVEVRWPTGPVVEAGGGVVLGRVEVFENVPADRFIMITEGSGEIVEIGTARTVQPQGKLPSTW